MTGEQVAAILPGSTIGVFGSGQLGRMLALAARRMGYRLFTFSPEEDSPTGQVADREYVGSYEDAEAVRRFVQSVDTVTFEFENVPAQVAEISESEGKPARPAGPVLHAAQNRLREKKALEDAGLPVTPHRSVNSFPELGSAAEDVGFPAILKTAAFGYDGKGQIGVDSRRDLEAAWRAVGRGPCVLEARVAFASELSLVAARGVDGSFAAYPLVENRHVDHILDLTIAPAAVDESVSLEAGRLARHLFETLNVVGVLCIEFFLMTGQKAENGAAGFGTQPQGRLLINEIAPRPHNSGHWTIEGAVTSQFEQQARTVCGLPTGSSEQLRPCVMLNLLGDLWERGEPDWSAVLSIPDVKLHLYGKREARPGRKMGHISVLADSTDEALETGLAARAMAAPK